MQLRPYQQKFNGDLARAVVTHQKVIACLPTGGGKTKCFLAISDSARAKGRTVLIVSESTKIFKQIVEEGKGVEISAAVKDKNFVVTPGALYIAMAQTLVRRPGITVQFHALGKSLIIVNDEAHVGTATKLLLKMPEALLIGFTATPDCRRGEHLSQIYKHCVVGAQVHDLIQEDFLTPYRHYARVGADMNELEIKAGEFTEESQAEAFGTTQVFDGLVEDLRTMPYKKCLIFTSSIAHCFDLTQKLMEHFSVVQVHSKEPKSAYNLYQFEHGDVNICVSIGVLTKGFDMAPIDLVIIQRATTSLPLYLQMCGRGSRLCPGKKYFTVLDYGENYKRHGLWDADRDWQALWKTKRTRKKKDDLKGVVPIKECPNCEGIVPANAAICPFCEFELIAAAELQQGELVEVTELYTNLVGRRISELSPVELATFAKLKNKRGWCLRVAKAHEQKTPGFLVEFGQHMNYKRGWAAHQEITAEPIEFYDLVLK